MIARGKMRTENLGAAGLFFLILLAMTLVVPVSAAEQGNGTNITPLFITIDPIGTPALGEVFTISGTTNLPENQTIQVLITEATYPMMPKIEPGSGIFGDGEWDTSVVAGMGNAPNRWSVAINTTGYNQTIFSTRNFMIMISVLSPTINVTNISEFNFAEPFIAIDPIGNHTVGDVFFINGTTNLPVTTGPLVLRIGDAHANPGGVASDYPATVFIQAGGNGVNIWSVNATVGPGWSVYPPQPNESIPESVSGSLGITQNELLATIYSPYGDVARQTFYLFPGADTATPRIIQTINQTPLSTQFQTSPTTQSAPLSMALPIAVVAAIVIVRTQSTEKK